MVLTESTIKLKAGDNAPDFKLKGIDNRNYSLKDFANKKLFLIVFMCNHCPYVKAKLQSIINLQKKFKNDLQIVGINSNDPNYEEEGFENMKKFATERGINFPYLFDDTQDVARTYDATCTPDPFLFDTNRKLVFHGRIDNALTLDAKPTEAVMESNIKKVLNGESITQQFLPSMGCSIKWK